MMASELQHGFRLGPCKVEPLRGAVTGPDGIERHLEPKVMDVLVCLAEHHNELVTREQLQDVVWSGRAVTDEPLTRAIGELRRALQNGETDTQYIETVPKRGYRLIGEIRCANESPAPFLARLREHRLASAAAIALVLTLAYFTYTGHPDNAAEVGVPTGASESPIAEKPAKFDPDVLAVMACDNWTGDPDLEYVANGIAEDIMHAVRRLGVQVIGRASTFSLKDRDLDIPTISQRLGAGYVLTCSVRRIPQSLRVSAQLTDGSANTALWTEDFDRDPKGVFDVARLIADAIPRQMQLAVDSDDNGHRDATGSADPDALDLYYQGRYFYNQITAAGARSAQELYQQALEIDPNYADAYAGIADAWIVRMQFEHIPQLTINEEIGRHLEKALELDSNSAAAWTAYGELMTITRQWDKADQALMQAIDIDPYDPQANLMTAQYYQVVGPARNALPYIEEAMRLDPLNAFASTNRINLLTYMREYDKALRASLDTMKRFPNFWLTHWSRALAYDGMGDYASMLTEVEKAIELLPAEEVNEVLPDKARALALLGRVDEALEILTDLESGDAANPVPAVKFAYIHEALGNYDQCLNYLEQGIEDGGWEMPWAMREQTLDGVRGTPRFKKMMERLGLSEDRYL